MRTLAALVPLYAWPDQIILIKCCIPYTFACYCPTTPRPHLPLAANPPDYPTSTGSISGPAQPAPNPRQPSFF